MSRRDRALKGTRIVGQGAFKLDRGRAMDKLGQFQLEDPHRYVLELVAAAIRAGATEIRVRNDVDDFEIEWDGRHATEDELDHLFDYVFGDPAEDHPRMLQHLAQGIFGAIGLQPKYVIVERPGLTLDFTDPLNIQRQANTRADGMKISVRERFSWAVARQFVTPFGHEHETELLMDAARTCPVPLIVNGKAIQLPLAKLFGAPAEDLCKDTERGRFFLRIRDADSDPGVALIRDGIIVDRLYGRLGPIRIGGWILGDDVRLNASRSKVITDEICDRHWNAAKQLTYPLILDYLRHPDPGISVVFLRAAAHMGMASRKGWGVTFHSERVFEDAIGRVYSLDELKAHKAVLRLDHSDPLDPEWEVPQFVFDPEDTPKNNAKLGALMAHLGDRFAQGSKRIANRLAGLRRRRRLSGRRHTMKMTAVVSHRVDTPTMQCWIAMGVEGTEAGHAGRINIHLFVDGLPVERIHIPYPSTMQANVSASRLRTDDRFERVLDGPELEAVKEAVREAARALEIVAVGQSPQHPVVRQAVLARIAATAKWKAGADVWDVLNALPPALAEAPIFTDLHGTHWSLPALLNKSEDRPPTLQVVNKSLPETVADPGVILLDLDNAFVSVLLELNGIRIDDVTQALEDRVEAERRQNLPRKQPVITQLSVGLGLARGYGPLAAVGHAESPSLVDTRSQQVRRQRIVDAYTGEVVVDARAEIDLPGIRGEVGLLQGGMDGICTVDVLHQGVHLCTLDVPTVFGHTRAVLEWDNAVPNTSWAGVTDADRHIADLGRVIAEPLSGLIRTQVFDKRWPTDHWTSAALPPWLADPLRAPENHGLGDIAFFRTVAGEPRTIAQLWSQRASGPVEYWMPELPGAGESWRAVVRKLPGLADVLVVDSSRHAMLNEIPVFENVSDRIDGHRLAWHRFVASKPAPGLPRHGWGFGTAAADDLTASAVLALDPAHPQPSPGIDISVLFQSRPLCTHIREHPLPAQVHVSGPAIVPDPEFYGLGLPEQLHDIDALAEAAVAKAVEALIVDEEAPLSAITRILVILVGPTAFPGVTTETAAQWRAALCQRPLFRTLGGVPISADTIQSAQADKALVWLHPSAAHLSAPDDRLWLIRTPATKILLPHLLGDALPPDETDRLRAIIIGRERREAAERQAGSTGFTVRSSNAPPAPPHLQMLYGADDTQLDITLRRQDIGIADDTMGTTLLWHAEGLFVCTEVRPEIPHLHIVVKGAGLEANEGFDGIVDNAAKQRVEALIVEGTAAFMDQVAQAVLVTTSPMFGRTAIVAWGATADLSAVWNDRVVARSATEAPLTIVDLRRISLRGPIRTVGPGVRGHTLDPERPAIPTGTWLQHALSQYGSVREYSEELQREEVIWQRANAKPVVPRAPEGLHVLLTLDVPGERRSGYLQVRTDAEENIRCYRDWRPLGTIAVVGDVPLSGQINDPDLAPNPEFTAPKDDEALQQLVSDLDALARDTLAAVLDAVDPAVHPALIHSLLVRLFRSKRAIRRATNTRGRLADLPVFRTVDGEPLSARQAVQRQGNLRWTTNPSPMAQVDPNVPIVFTHAPIGEELHELLGGGNLEYPQMLEAIQLYNRQQSIARPFELPMAWEPYFAQCEAAQTGMRAAVGLSASRLRRGQPGLMFIRSATGVPIQEMECSWCGMVAVVEVPVSQIELEWREAKLHNDQLRAIFDRYDDLVEQAQAETPRAKLIPAVCNALETIRESDSSVGSMSKHIEASPKDAWVRAWTSPPLLQTPDGSASLAEVMESVRRTQAVLIGSESLDGDAPLMVVNDRLNRRLLEAAGLEPKVLTIAKWRASQAADAKRKRDENAANVRARAEDKWEKAVRKRIQSLMRGLDSVRVVYPACTLPQESLEDPFFRWIAAWNALEPALVQADRLSDAHEVSVRLAERLS
jgi:hypothetical protein